MSSEEPATAATPVKEKGENKIRVIGARRVWGTLKSSNVKSVKNVIARVCKVGEVRVVRKDRVKPDMNKSMWWYVIHAILSDLETKWNLVNVQTGWKLELCFMADSTPSPLVETETEQQPASKVTSEDLSSQIDPPMASAYYATSTLNVMMSWKDDSTTPDSIGENDFS